MNKSELWFEYQTNHPDVVDFVVNEFESAIYIDENGCPILRLHAGEKHGLPASFDMKKKKCSGTSSELCEACKLKG